MKRAHITGSLRDGLRRAASIALLALATDAVAADDDAIDSGILNERARPGIEQATGFIVDRTITQFGAEFVRFFSEAWRDQGAAEGVDVTVVERPSARWGSVVYIEYNNQPVARVFLYAGRSAAIKPLAVEAARYVAGRAADNALAGLLMRDPDLAKEGF